MKRWLAILGVLIFIPIISSFAQPIFPTPTPTINIVTGADIFVRGGPGRTYIPVGHLVRDEVVFPVGRNDITSWIMIRYNTGFGWIRRDLAFWQDDLEALPIVDPQNLTPSPSADNQTTTLIVATETPIGNWVNVGRQGAFVRAGPGRTYLRLDTLFSGEVIEEPVGRNANGSWIMFRRGEGFGWIALNLVHWVDSLEDLPVLADDALTPTATFTPSNTPTFTPTPTLTHTPSSTPTVTLTSTSTNTATYTPTNTDTATATLTPTNTATSTPSVTATVTPSLTPTTTLTATNTDVPTSTATITPSLTITLTHTSTATVSLTPTLVPTSTATNTATSTDNPTATVTNTATSTASLTSTPTMTSSATATHTIVPTETPTATLTVTATPTDTPTFTTTVSSTPVFSATSVPSDTPRPTVTPTQTATTVEAALVPTVEPTESPTTTPTSSDTPIPTSTDTATATSTDSPEPPTPTFTSTQTAIPEPTITQTPVPTATITETAVIVVQPTEVPATLIPQATPDDSGDGRLSIEALIGSVVVIAVLIYIGLYFRGLAAANRYAQGFVYDVCPVCRRGAPLIEHRQERWFGIPRIRHIVRCSECRSVLREIGNRLWRYAVDPLENPVIYEQYNGQEIDEAELEHLAQNPPSTTRARQPRPPADPPSFVDGDDQ